MLQSALFQSPKILSPFDTNTHRTIPRVPVFTSRRSTTSPSGSPSPGPAAPSPSRSSTSTSAAHGSSTRVRRFATPTAPRPGTTSRSSAPRASPSRSRRRAPRSSGRYSRASRRSSRRTLGGGPPGSTRGGERASPPRMRTAGRLTTDLDLFHKSRRAP